MPISTFRRNNSSIIYEGMVTRVVAKTTDGRTVQFFTQILRPIVLADEVQGLFELVFNENYKFISISRVYRSNYSHNYSHNI